jgi:predicted O-methyltransferase YrrM
LQDKFLAGQCRITGAKNVLEIGTLGGYSSLWFASAGLDVHVASIEADA